jgi:hypothetical protein
MTSLMQQAVDSMSIKDMELYEKNVRGYGKKR